MNTYNEWVRYYLENELDPRMPDVIDKLKFKDYATSKGVATAAVIQPSDNCVLKVTSDSGGVAIVKDGHCPKYQRLFKYKDKPYGIDKGEWFYKDIQWQMFAEEYLGDNLTDYKFHCHNGRVMFCQVIFDRSTGNTKECLVLPDRTILDYRLDENFKFSKDITIPDNWDDLLTTATKLAKDWKYVRVDLYNTDKIYAGELTFAPRAGKYTGIGQEKLGRYFDLHSE